MDRGRDTRALADAIVRPYVGFDRLRWALDGRRLLVQLRPPGRQSPPVRKPARPATQARSPPAARVVNVDSAPSCLNALLVDLARVEVATGRVTRLRRRVRPMTTAHPVGLSNAMRPLHVLARVRQRRDAERVGGHVVTPEFAPREAGRGGEWKGAVTASRFGHARTVMPQRPQRWPPRDAPTTRTGTGSWVTRDR